MDCWEDRLRLWYGMNLPDDYLTFDCETTGVRRDFDLPIDFGYTLVRGRKPVQRRSLLLDWTRYPDFVETAWLAEALHDLRLMYRQKGQPYHYSVQRLKREGKDPLRVLRFALDLFKANRTANAMFAGHNAIFFDGEMLKNCFKEYLGERWVFGPDELFDTGCMEKAMMICEVDWPNMVVPKKGESLKAFFTRVYAMRRRGIFWNIDTCVERYRLKQRFNVDPAKTHGAELDSYVCHLLLEDHRSAVETA